MPTTDIKENQAFRDIPVTRLISPTPMALSVSAAVGNDFARPVEIVDHYEREIFLWKESDGKGNTRIKRETFKQVEKMLTQLSPEDAKNVMSDERFAKWHRRRKRP